MLDPALLSYVIIMSVTPGPNNMMLATSGVQFGLRRTLPHLVGISGGLGMLVFLISSLLSCTLTLLEAVRLPLALAGCVYLLWLSRKIAQAARPEGASIAKPLGLIGAALFQWFNPKVWVMVLNIALFFTPSGRELDAGNALLLASACALINLPCIGIWAIAGDRLRRVLSTQRGLMLFNLGMALLMAATALWLMLDELQPWLGRI
jgi:threonine/homoserine/homoserine lactone efflux protein